MATEASNHDRRASQRPDIRDLAALADDPGDRMTFSHEDVERLSLKLEDETGYDSIPTIEHGYRGECCFPDCHFRRRDAVEMWKHVHFSRKHGLSFGATLNDLIASEFASKDVPQ